MTNFSSLAEAYHGFFQAMANTPSPEKKVHKMLAFVYYSFCLVRNLS